MLHDYLNPQVHIDKTIIKKTIQPSRKRIYDGDIIV